MTTRDETRRGTADLRPDPGRPESGRPPADRPGSGRGASSGVDPVPSLPERLYAARERKGVDLYRAERDTKIRARYLAALEHGDYAELPGAVYTKGFLRNYALYLALDPDEVVRQWRHEGGDAFVPHQAVLDVPASVNSVASSPTSTTAVTGEVTASVGGFANRTSWMPR